MVEDLYRIDSGFLEHDGHVAVYLFNTDKPVLIDTAASTCTEHVLNAFDELPLAPSDVKYLFVSHLHLDHAGGAGYLLDEFENATVLVHERGKPFLTEEERVRDLVESAHRATGELASGYGDVKPIPEGRIRTLADGEELDLGDRSLEVIAATGHAPHQLTLFEPRRRWLYPADEAGLRIDDRAIPATPPPDFDLGSTVESLTQFRTLRPVYLVYPHYGIHEDALSALKTYETLLRKWVRTVRDARDRLASREAIVDAMVADDAFYPTLWDDVTREQIVRTDTLGVLRYLNQGE